ncbi:MAG: hypothetical protein B6I36_02700 [Desulfobacteraceae bacterium 4572_35.1]|nr:MAG: hypothetical protein B6I36_02700 [Desulfobacteraceae bacterium 4572_35.1]
MTMIPAYIMLFVSEKKLAQIPDHQSTAAANTNSRPAEGMLPLLYKMGKISTSHRIPILLVTLALIITSIYGITRIQVNDNPVKWFSNDHEIRVADKVLNHHFGGTYTAYLTLTESRPAACNCTEKSQSIETQLRRNYGKRFPKATEQLVNKLHYLRDQQVLGNCNISNCFYQLIQEADRIDKQVLSGWSILADEVNYLDPEGLNLNNLDKRLQAIKPSASIELKLLSQQLAIRAPLSGNALIDAALLICDEYLGKSFHTFIVDMEAELSAPPFKQPKMLRYVEQLQQHLQNSGLVGKSSSAVDALKKANYELKYRSATADANAITQEGLAAHNRANFVIPDKASAVAQVFVQLEGMKKKDSLFHMVTRDYRNANIWVQLKSGDNRDMEAVVKAVDSYIASHPAPLQLKTRWAGLTYLNVVWQDKMVRGMISSLLSSFIVVLIMMILLFRSTLWGLLAMVPLSITITMIYGIIGLVGKDYDMPVAVLSSLTLGLSVDFAIHFLKRARDLQHQTGNWNQTIKVMFQDPARAISRNAITISIGFLPLLLAPLVPYKTVGFFLATIMILSWLATLLILPSLLSILFKWAFPEGDSK